ASVRVPGGPAPSPHAKSFDPLHLPRIQAVEKDLDYWLTYFDRSPGERYVSDGDPGTITVVSRNAGKLGAASGARVLEREEDTRRAGRTPAAAGTKGGRRRPRR